MTNTLKVVAYSNNGDIFSETKVLEEDAISYALELKSILGDKCRVVVLKFEGNRYRVFHEVKEIV